jgi:predicted GTPase
VLLWDGGNNDTPFVIPDLEIVLLDPHRAGHEQTYFRGGVNLLRVDVLVLTKMDTASPEQIHVVRANIRQLNPKASVLETVMPVIVDHSHLINGKRVLVIEDGSTFTHGDMSFGAGVLAAKQQGAKEFVDPRAYAQPGRSNRPSSSTRILAVCFLPWAMVLRRSESWEKPSTGFRAMSS